MNDNKELSLQEIQRGSFQVLLKIKEIFDENNWEYYLAYGSLIGAVRHKGFIPWDDDIDLWIPRPYYEKFVDYCIEHKDELYPFELMHYRTNKKYIYPIARFSDSRYELDYDNAKDYGLGLFVDLYPMDGLDPNDKKILKKIERMNKLICMCGSKKNVKGKNKIKNILKIPYYNIVKHYDINKLLEKDDRIAQKYPYEKYDTIAVVCWVNDFHIFNKSDFAGKKKMKFNNEKVRIPKEYDAILTENYGDYMSLPPVEKQVAHHNYKAYKKQENDK